MMLSFQILQAMANSMLSSVIFVGNGIFLQLRNQFDQSVFLVPLDADWIFRIMLVSYLSYKLFAYISKQFKKPICEFLTVIESYRNLKSPLCNMHVDISLL